MRIRSIKPEFWRSDDIDSLDWHDRLLFIGLWSYVDDNGVGRDKVANIAADIFAGDLSVDPTETLRRVSLGLNTLAGNGQIVRYRVASKDYLHITAWDRHQLVKNPNKARYPLPTCDYSESTESLRTSSVVSTETLPTGTGEQGSRGIEKTCAPAGAGRETDADFEVWYGAYPRKRGRAAATKAYSKARKKTDADALLGAVKAQTPSLMRKGAEFCPYPATWLNEERWADQPDSLSERQVPSSDSWMSQR